MALLTRKEQTIIKALKSCYKVNQSEQLKMVQIITFNATVRKAGHKTAVKEFISAMADFNSDKILNLIK